MRPAKSNLAKLAKNDTAFTAGELDIPIIPQIKFKFNSILPIMDRSRYFIVNKFSRMDFLTGIERLSQIIPVN